MAKDWGGFTTVQPCSCTFYFYCSLPGSIAGSGALSPPNSSFYFRTSLSHRIRYSFSVSIERPICIPTPLLANQYLSAECSPVSDAPWLPECFPKPTAARRTHGINNPANSDREIFSVRLCNERTPAMASLQPSALGPPT